ncbi:uncharacterized protein LOC128246671 [Mya arenaria]|uniref:uncharacterized protein LOC128246671 n=1 Tax=Mya arenaria TaxID=6604 RepID=UPI0022E69665|nr:uncharacterized protein LOC128246671 [Mya arenaria]
MGLMESMFIRRFAVIMIFTMITQCKGTVLLTTDKQYATLYGQITLTCSVNMDGANDVNFKRGSSKLFQLGSCDIFECQTVNTTKYKILKNTQTKKFDLVNLTINDFRETDSDNYHCEVVNNGDSGSIFLTYTAVQKLS